MGTSVKAPPPMSYSSLMTDALGAQGSIQGQYLDLERLYRPQYRELQRQDLLGTLGTYNDFMAQANPMASQLAGQFAEGMTPVMGQIGAGAMQNYMAMLSPEARNMFGMMNQQANEGLAAGYGMTAGQQTLAQQAARAAMAARGLTGNQAVAQEVLNSEFMAQQRQDRARKFAAETFGINQGLVNNSYQLLGAPLASQAMAFNPMNAMQLASGLQQQVGSITNPESQAAFDIAKMNQDMQMQARAASAANKAALWSAGIQAVGSMVGGKLSQPTG